MSAGAVGMGILFIVAVAAFICIIVPVNTAGVVILHNGTPIHNLAVSATYGGNSGPFMTGTTDGTGTFVVHTNLANYGSTILYDFSINGTGYSFGGPATSMVTVSV